MIATLGDKKLVTSSEDFWIAPDANVIGDIRMSKDSSIWFNATLRGDNEPIIIGFQTPSCFFHHGFVL